MPLRLSDHNTIHIGKLYKSDAIIMKIGMWRHLLPMDVTAMSSVTSLFRKFAKWFSSLDPKVYYDAQPEPAMSILPTGDVLPLPEHDWWK